MRISDRENGRCSKDRGFRTRLEMDGRWESNVFRENIFGSSVESEVWDFRDLGFGNV